VVGQDDESTLVNEEGVSFDDESMGLVDIIGFQVAVRFEKLLPINGKLSLDKVKQAELHGLHTFLIGRLLHELVG